jgi:large subunit ribosomal protein L9
MEAAERAAEARREREAQAAGLLGKTVLTIHQRAGEDGRLFGSVGPKEIVDALREARDLRIEKKQVQLEQPLRELGTFMIGIQLSDGTTAEVKTIISEEK